MKITKQKFMEIMLEAISAQTAEISERTDAGMASMAITLMGVSIMHKTLERLFPESEEEIETITDKE